MNKTLQFLKQLNQNNSREWFQSQDKSYQQTQEELKLLVKQIEANMNMIDSLDTASTKVFRIYRDVRFSKNKTPYNIHRSASFRRLGAERRGGYYLRIENGASMIAGGFFGPQPADLLHIRKQIQQEPDQLQKIIDHPDIISFFGGLTGEQVKTSPRGFDKDHPALPLIKYKHFLLKHTFSDSEVISDDFSEKVKEGFAKMRPFLDYMTGILTTDLNGEPII